MPASLLPTVDSGNPMYCPDVPATLYLQCIQQMRRASQELRNSFPHPMNSRSCHSDRPCCQTTSSPVNFPLPQQFLRPSLATIETDTIRFPKRKHENSPSYHDLSYRSKRIRSDITQTSSFILSPDQNQPHLPTLLCAAPLQDSSDGFYQELFKKVKFHVPINPSHCSPRRVAALELELYGRAIGKETGEDVSRLLDDLSGELPGTSLTHQLSHLDHVSHQDIVDLLGVNGHLARHILEYFRASLIQRLDLSSTLSDEDGLNVLTPHTVLDIFTLPHSFTRLQILNLNNVQLDDFHLTKIHHLPSLSTLWLNHTGIGNEGVGHLTALKLQLKELYIDDNPRINDDCISSLCLFSSLTVLSILGTKIQMAGLRRLAASVHEAQGELNIEIPQECDAYLNRLHMQYLLHPSPPLITSPHLCTSLSMNALKMNLAAHSSFNPSIGLSGSRTELVDRLQGILERRLADGIVKEVVWGYESSDGASEADSSMSKTNESDY